VKRIFWFIVGTAVGIYAVTRLRKRAQLLAPDSLQSTADKMASAIRHFGDEVRAGMAEREAELREALGIDTAESDREDYR
jgi:chromosome condensin MukBEF MukE localization factor